MRGNAAYRCDHARQIKIDAQHGRETFVVRNIPAAVGQCRDQRITHGPSIESGQLVEMLADQYLGHFLQYGAERFNLIALAGNADHRYRLAVELHRHVDAVPGAGESMLVIHAHGLFAGDGQSRTVMPGTDACGVGAGDDDAAGIEEVDFVAQRILEMRHDVGGDIRIDFHTKIVHVPFLSVEQGECSWGKAHGFAWVPDG